MVRILLLLILTVTAIRSSAAGTAENTATAIFDSDFRTLQTKVNGNDMLPPIIIMGSDDVLSVEFDELAAERRYLRYELLHCDAQWRHDRLLPSEYIEGFNEYTIDDYSFSQATLTQYVHYRLLIPNPEMKIKLSGNYLLRVYDESSPADILLQQRFCIAEPLMNASASVTSRTDIDFNRDHQQLLVRVDSKGLSVNNLMTDVIISVEQNGRTDNVVTLNGPDRIAGSTAIWEHSPKLIFPAGNEYRRMEVISTSYPGMGVEEITFAHPYYHISLQTDEPRAEAPYSYDQTQKGRFRIREYNSTDSDTEAEYVMVHFALDMPELQSKDIFIEGDLTNRSFSPESLMVFNRATGRYEHSMLLKQGAYNYEYLTVDHGSETGSYIPVEGNHYQTANEYLIKVYYRQPGARYDRLVAVTSVTAGV